MSEITRRRLLGNAAVGAGGALASSLLPPALARAAARGPQKGSLKDVEHVVVHMQENRSFDHYFGTLAGVRGFGDPNVPIQSAPSAVDGKSLFYQQDPYNPDGYLLPWHLDTRTPSSQAIPSTSHAWTYQHDSLDITVSSTPGAPTTAMNNKWVPTHYISDGPAHYWYTMGYYEREDIPFHFVTGVVETNITPRRRQTFGDLTSALGFSNGKASTFPPRLPQTIGEFWEAEHEVETLPAPTIPGAVQTVPVQQERRGGVPWTPQPPQRREGRSRRALPGTSSRFIENRTTHPADFGKGESDKGVSLEVGGGRGQGPRHEFGHDVRLRPRDRGGSVAVFDSSTHMMGSSILSGTTNPYGVAARNGGCRRGP